MPEEIKEVEKKDGNASTVLEEVKKNPPVASPDDPEARIADLEAKLAKTASDRDNYRDATLVLKGKKKPEMPDLADPEELNAHIIKTVRETLAESENEQVLKTILAEARINAQKVKELTRALASKNASTSIAGGAGAGSGDIPNSEKQTSYFSPEQIKELKDRGLTDAQIKTIEELDKSGAPGSAKTR
jgi:hypothetical protein